MSIGVQVAVLPLLSVINTVTGSTVGAVAVEYVNGPVQYPLMPSKTVVWVVAVRILGSAVAGETATLVIVAPVVAVA
jgi:hypothetical protein